MSLLVTGTIGIDTVETPTGKAEAVLGGSAAYFSFAAALLTPVRLVAAVGDDFPKAFLDRFQGHDIDTTGLEVRAGAKTFRWAARYLDDMNERQTLRTDLNIVADSPPPIPPAFRDSRFVFLANTHPAVQRRFLEQLDSPEMIVCDTMNLWIETTREELLQTLALVHGVVLNDGEAKMLTHRNNLLAAAQAILELGPRFVVVKKGEHGAMLVTPEDTFVLPAFPTTRVVDPTGAGDSFGGGMMGYLAATERTDRWGLRSALAAGTCVASMTIEDFSLNALLKASRSRLEARLADFKLMLAFD